MPLYNPVPDSDDEDEERMPYFRRQMPKGPPPDMDAFLAKPPKPPESCPEGKSLWLLGNYLEDHHAKVLAKWLNRGEYQYLEYINMGYNKITSDGFLPMAMAISNGALPKLTYISLCENPIGDAGAKALASALPKMPNLDSIEMSICGIGDEGAVAWFNAMAKGGAPKLEALYFKGNVWADDGMEAFCLAKASGKCKKLRSAFIGENRIGDEGALCLANAIEAGHFDDVNQINLAPSPYVTRDGREVIADVIKEFDKKPLQVIF
jgi:Ran GTPase-activating protein (RanGAP) involved in mRNA processing and transport